jgi:hypothetical protein
MSMAGPDDGGADRVQVGADEGRSWRRRPRGPMVAGAWLAALALLAIGRDVLLDDTPDPAPGAGSAAGVRAIDVECTDRGVIISSPQLAAGPAGASVLVSSSARDGALLNWLPRGSQGEGLPLSDEPTLWLLHSAPGPVELSCSLDGEQGTTARKTIDVVDPRGYWRPATLAGLGCSPGGRVSSRDVAAVGGETAEQAVSNLLGKLSSGGRGRLTIRKAEVGYVASTPTWIASRRGRPAFTVVVGWFGSTFTARPDRRCV